VCAKEAETNENMKGFEKKKVVKRKRDFEKKLNWSERLGKKGLKGFEKTFEGFKLPQKPSYLSIKKFNVFESAW